MNYYLGRKQFILSHSISVLTPLYFWTGSIVAVLSTKTKETNADIVACESASRLAWRKKVYIVYIYLRDDLEYLLKFYCSSPKWARQNQLQTTKLRWGHGWKWSLGVFSPKSRHDFWAKLFSLRGNFLLNFIKRSNRVIYNFIYVDQLRWKWDLE